VTQGTPAKLAAGCCALGAFAVAIIAGLAAENAADVILTRAIVCMSVCYLVGALIGAVGSRAIEEGVRAHQAANPAAESASDPETPEESEGELVV